MNGEGCEWSRCKRKDGDGYFAERGAPAIEYELAQISGALYGEGR